MQKIFNKYIWKKNNSLESNTLKLKEKLTISENHLPKKFEKSSLKPNKSTIKIKFFKNTWTPADSFIDNLVKGKETLILHTTQFFTPQEAIKQKNKTNNKNKNKEKQKLELRNLPPVDLCFDGNPVHCHKQFWS